MWMKQSYRKQELEHTYKKMVEHKQSLTRQLHMAKNPADIKQFATTLGMTTVKISQVKQLPYS